MLDVVHTAKIEQSSCVVEEIWELIGSNLFFSCLAAFFSLKETCVARVFLLFTLREAGFSKPCMDRHLLLYLFIGEHMLPSACPFQQRYFPKFLL